MYCKKIKMYILIVVVIGVRLLDGGALSVLTCVCCVQLIVFFVSAMFCGINFKRCEKK